MLLLKSPPLIDKLPISSFLMHMKDHYRIDKTYQRDSDIWENWMEAITGNSAHITA